MKFAKINNASVAINFLLLWGLACTTAVAIWAKLAIQLTTLSLTRPLAKNLSGTKRRDKHFFLATKEYQKFSSLNCLWETSIFILVGQTWWPWSLNHRIIRVGKISKMIKSALWPNTTMPTRPYHSVTTILFLNFIHFNGWTFTSMDGESTLSLGSPFHSSTSLSVMKFIWLWCNISPFTLILLLGAWENRLTLYDLLFPYIKLHLKLDIILVTTPWYVRHLF